MNTLNGLTGLRWIAAFYVFLFHIDMRLNLNVPTFFKRVISQGALGVTLFFVLSGFILAYTYYKKGKISYGNFMYKRLARIYPAYVTGWLLCILVSLVLNYYPEPFALVTGLDLLAVQSYFPSVAQVWYGAGAWSISTEFFFYSLFPLILPLLVRLSRKQLTIALFCGVGLSIVPGFLIHILRLPLEFTQLYCFPPARFPEFLSGMCASLLVFKYKVTVNRYWPVIAVAVALVYLYVIGYRLSIVGHNFIAVPTFILLLAAISKNNYAWISSRPMVYLGKISYGFYITQLPIMMFLDVVIDRDANVPYPWLLSVGVLALNILMAAALYRFVEHPAHLYLNKRLEKKKIKLQPQAVKAA